MATYIILNSIFIAVVVIVLRLRPVRPLKAWLATLVILLILTAIFDNALIHYSVVEYDTSKLLGAYIGIAPVEDFFYTLLAALLIPSLWKKLGETNA